MVLKTASLSETILSIVLNKGTESPFTGEYNDFEGPGTYLCRLCGLALFRSETKFNSGCGWPSFDGEIFSSIVKKPDRDGKRTEILCSRCHAHLGHVFEGERYTENNIRYCVNSLSLDYVPNFTVMDTEEAIVAGGCFWGVEYYLKQLDGVLKTEVGYSGGTITHPNYFQVCSGKSGHYESVRIIYDPTKLNYEKLIKYFFEIHDPTQIDGQGPDHGEQYLSVIFYYDDIQKQIASALIKQLEHLGYDVATLLLPVSAFWRAEDHQNYYAKTKKMPYCHQYVKRFKDT